jgi:8-oxo-dGTP diphosphatase
LHCCRCGTELTDRRIEGRQRLVCPACGYVAYGQLKVGAGVLVERDGALLLAQRGPAADAFPNTWNLPSGYCEADEPPPVTAAREVFEETGLQVQVGRLVDVYFFDDDPRGNGLLLVYEATISGGQPGSLGECLKSCEEVAATGFFRPGRLPEPLCGGGHDHAIQAWQARALDRWQPGTPMRYCPHCTHPLEKRVAFGRLRPVCPACGFVHFRDPKVGVSVLVEQEGRVLLVQRAIDPGQGRWCLPSGFVEWDESPETAAARECLEETGLAVELLNLMEVAHYTDDFRGPGVNLTFRARVMGGRLRPGDDAAAIRFFAPAELPIAEAVAFVTHRSVLEQWQAAQNRSLEVQCDDDVDRNARVGTGRDFLSDLP